MIRFGRFTIDTRTWRLARDGQPCDLSPRLVEILAFLIERRGAIVTKNELLDRFWPGINITENTLTRAIADIRIALGDSASEPTYIQTLARRGYEKATRSYDARASAARLAGVLRRQLVPGSDATPVIAVPPLKEAVRR